MRHFSKTSDIALLDSIGLVRFRDECVRLRIVISESEGDLPIAPAPRFSRSRADVSEAFISPLAVGSDTDVNGTVGAILDEDSTHCPIALWIRI